MHTERMASTECGFSADEHFITTDVLREVLGRMDAVTLARASCVSSQYRSVCNEEAFWERLCNARWTSTKEASVRTLIASVGGFRKFYKECFSFILCHRASSLRQREDGACAVKESALPSDFVSIVDVVYNGEAVCSRVVDGIPGIEFAFGPLVDILEATDLDSQEVSLEKDEDEEAVVTIHMKNPRVVSITQERRDGKFWLALCEQIRVSWVLLHKKSKQLINIGSWKPLGGVRHRPRSDDFLLHFGSIIPTNCVPVHCNIFMKCRTATTATRSDNNQAAVPKTTILKVTELSMHLENVYGVHLRGHEAIKVLSQALTCEKTTDERRVSSMYHDFMATQHANREALIRREKYQQTAGAVLFVVIIMIVISIII